MKKNIITLLIVSLSSGTICLAQDIDKAIRERNLSYNPNERNLSSSTSDYTCDSMLKSIDFGTKKDKKAFVVTFPYKSKKPVSTFTFSQSQIKKSYQTKNSGVTNILLMSYGIDITFNPSNKIGQVDDTIVLYTTNGNLNFRLTGTIIPSKK